MKQILRLLIFFLVLGLTSLTKAEMVKYIDENGKIHYVDTDYGKVPDRYKHQIKATETKQETKVTETTAPNVPALPVLQQMTTQQPPQIKSVEIFVSANCPKCMFIESIFKNANVKYSRYDINTDPAARKRYTELNVNAIPVIIIGSQVMTEFDTNKFFAAIRSAESSKESPLGSAP